MLVLLLLALAAAWKWSGLAAFVEPERISGYLEPLRTHWYGLPVVVLVFVVAELLLFPVLVLVFVCGIAFGPVLGTLYALAGSLASAVPPFLLGRKLGGARLERIGGPLVRRIEASLEGRGVVAIFVARKIPAPYTLVNLVCGASPVSLRDFLVGTLLGMGTGVLLITVLGAQLMDFLRDRRPWPVLAALGLLFVPLLIALAVQRGFNRRAESAGAKRANDAEPPVEDAAPSASPAPVDGDPILRPGENCWRIERAERFRCVQDGDLYFRLVREAILAARRSVFILGWDIYAEVDLAPDADADGAPSKLAALLDFAVRRTPELEIYVLIWDYAALYVFERDPLSRIRFGLRTHERVHFQFDGHHPIAGCHHQKIVVVDDRLAFSGGIDLTSHRWDTAEHALEEPRRLAVNGEPYEPFHDVQALVEGPVAAALGQLARERWTRIGTRDLPPLEPRTDSLWPASAPPDFTDVDVAIARTDPLFRGRAGVRECEKLFHAEIAAARDVIYLENQYFTNAGVGEALAQRLREPDGPEIVILSPRECSGWLEQRTMGALRQRVLAHLLDSDVHGRLRLVHPFASRERNVCTFIHSKILVIDDVHLRIGSANLSNRSLGMDTECDLVVTARGDPGIAAGIRHVRDRLIGEHFALGPEEIAEAIEKSGSLRGAIDALASGDRMLAPVDVDRDAAPETWKTIDFAIDPGEPIAVSRTIDRLQPAFEVDDSRKATRAIFVLLCLSGLLLIALRGASGAATLDAQTVQEFLYKVEHDEGAGHWIFAALVAGGLLFVPFELLVLVPVVLLSPERGGAIAVAAGVVCATVGYLLGRALGPKRITPLMTVRARNAWKGLGRYGALSVAVVRFVALFSATSVHVLCGAARIGLRDFALGSVLGLAPALLASIALGALLRQLILHPSPLRSLLTIGLALALALFVLRLRRIVLMGAHGRAEREQRLRSTFG